MKELDMPIVFISTQRTNVSENLFPQKHEYYELNYLTRGRTKINLDGLMVSYEAHDFILIPPRMQHNLYSAKDESYRNYTIRFTGNAEFYNAYLYIVLMHLRRGTILDVAAAAAREEDPVEKAIRWYCDNMGFELVYETVYQGHDIPENVAFIRKDDVTYELYEFLGGEEREQVIAAPKLIDHIAYRVDDVEKAYEEAKRLGLNIKKEIQDLPFWDNGCRYFMVTTANGDTVEYMQML